VTVPECEHYVTLFDITFAPQGVALHASLSRQSENFCLWVLCMDQETFRLLTLLKLKNVVPLSRLEWETRRLREISVTRSWREYCWTVTPFTFDIVFERSDAQRVTYVDADIWFYRPPRPLFDLFERGNHSALITDHGYAPEYDMTRDHGRFCVQFLTFDRLHSASIRRRWQEQCLEWCFEKPDGNRYGDQKYLDSWPKDYGDSVLIPPPSLFLGPWNAVRFPHGGGVGYHFHKLRVNPGSRLISIGRYEIPGTTFEKLYQPYVLELRRIHNQMKCYGFEPRNQLKVGRRALSRFWIGRALSVIWPRAIRKSKSGLMFVRNHSL